MKYATLAIAALAAGALGAFSPLAMLARPSSDGPDPSVLMARTSSSAWPARLHPLVATTGESAPTSLTWGAWMKLSGQSARWGSVKPINAYAIGSFFCPKTSLATKEGGPSLPNLLSHPDSEPLPLDANGDWTDAGVLPSSYDLDGMDVGTGDWTNGCYCVNVRTDEPVTLTVAGVQREIPASAEVQIFNMNGLGASRDVSVHASSPDAVVYLGVAENPFRRFYGADLNMMKSGSGAGWQSDPLDGFCGLNETEWQFVVFRAALGADSNLVYDARAFAADVDYDAVAYTNRVASPYAGADGRPRFAPWSRVATAAYSMAPDTQDVVRIETRGAFVEPSWLPDGQVLGRRAAGVRWLRAHGAEFPRLAPDWWQLYYTVVLTNRTVTASWPRVEETGAAGLVGTNGYVTSYSAVYSLTNGHASTRMFNIGDVRLVCRDGEVHGNRIDFPGPGTYDVQAVDPVGNVRTNSTSIQAAALGHVAWAEYREDAEGTWQKAANDAVKSNVLAAARGATVNYTPWETPTNFTRWSARRIPCQPVNAAWNMADAEAGRATTVAQGHYAVHPVSAHCFASAIHYGWTIGTCMRFVSLDGSETGCVRTVGMEWMATNGPAWFSLSAWARNNGFTAEQAACVSDVIVHRAAEGEVPPKCRPYFMRPSTAAAHFGTAGVLGWGTTQHAFGIGVPVLFRQPSNTWWFSSWIPANKFPAMAPSSRTGYNATNFSQLMRKDVRDEALAKCDQWNFVEPYGGDSGLPLYVEVDGKFVLVSHYRGVGDGPSYTTGFEILKAWVESQGDELEEIGP